MPTATLPNSMPGHAPARPSTQPPLARSTAPTTGGRATTRPPREGATQSSASIRPGPAIAEPSSDNPEHVPLTLELASIKAPREIGLPLDIESDLSDIAGEISASLRGGGAAAQARAGDARGADLDSAAKRRIPTTDEGQALLQDLEAAFGAMVEAAQTPTEAEGSSRPTPSPSSKPPSDTPAAVHELFSALAANHMRQVRDLIIGLHWNEPVADWQAICQPAITSLLAAAKQLENDELCTSLEGFETAIQQASPEGRNLSEATRQKLIDAYKRLAKQLPDTFSLDAEASRRETVIVHSLLQQIPEVTRLAIDKLYAAGLSRLEFFVTATPEEIVQTTGISTDVAARIIDKFRDYRRVALKGNHDAVHSTDRGRLAELRTALRKLEEEYERAAEGWTDDAVARKRELRRLRSEVFLEIKVVLARLGELTCLSDLDKMSFREKIVYLERFLRMTTPPQAPHS